jgi:IMP dehydrogenase
MLAGTDETPGQVYDNLGIVTIGKQEGRSGPLYKKYRGSASKESYEAQGKDQAYITAEGESFTVPYKGSVADILSDIEGGLRSAMTYVGAASLQELRQKAQFVEISSATQQENGAHGKR